MSGEVRNGDAVGDAPAAGPLSACVRGEREEAPGAPAAARSLRAHKLGAGGHETAAENAGLKDRRDVGFKSREIYMGAWEDD